MRRALRLALLVATAARCAPARAQDLLSAYPPGPRRGHFDLPTSTPVPEPPSSLARGTATASITVWYYRSDGLGAHAFYTPISNIIAGGFSPFGDRRLYEFDFAKGARNLWSSLRNPIEAVRKYGVGDYFYGEFLPNPGKSTGQWVPNWTWHLIGGGFRTRLLKEYYIEHGFEHPTLYAWLTAYSNHLINELIQAERYPPESVDCISDLLFFDWVGKLIFDIDAVNRVATGLFHLTDWTTQTSPWRTRCA